MSNATTYRRSDAAVVLLRGGRRVWNRGLAERLKAGRQDRQLGYVGAAWERQQEHARFGHVLWAKHCRGNLGGWWHRPLQKDGRVDNARTDDREADAVDVLFEPRAAGQRAHPRLAGLVCRTA